MLSPDSLYGKSKIRLHAKTVERFEQKVRKLTSRSSGKNPGTRVRNLEKLGITHKDAMLCGNARKKYWRMGKVKWVAIAMPETYFVKKGLFLPGNKSS